MYILIVEDEQSLMESIVTYLEMEGFKCLEAYDYHTALTLIDKHNYMCMLIDLNLPDGDGLELVKIARRNDEKGGIIIISARDAIDHRITGLEAGADDYLVKPFNLSEMVARVQSVIRRTRFQGGNYLEFGVIRIQPEERRVFIKGKHLDLTKKEYELLIYLMSNRNRVITKESIAEYLWGEYSGGYGSYEFVYTHLKNLRRKLMDKGCPDYIKNVYGVGYKFTSE